MIDLGDARDDLDAAAYQRIHATHWRFFETIARHGTEEERAAVLETIAAMREWRLAFPGSGWEPMTEVTLPSFLISRSRRVAAEFIQRARERNLRDRHGATRDLQAEIAALQGRYAACLMLGIPFKDVPTQPNSVKAHGNLGGGRGAYTPKEGWYSLIVHEDTPPSRKVFLILRSGQTTYECPGWVRAGEVQIPDLQKTFHRNGIAAHPYVVTSDRLRPLRDFFA